MWQTIIFWIFLVSTTLFLMSWGEHCPTFMQWGWVWIALDLVCHLEYVLNSGPGLLSWLPQQWQHMSTGFCRYVTVILTYKLYTHTKSGTYIPGGLYNYTIIGMACNNYTLIHNTHQYINASIVLQGPCSEHWTSWLYTCIYHKRHNILFWYTIFPLYITVEESSLMVTQLCYKLHTFASLKVYIMH